MRSTGHKTASNPYSASNQAHDGNDWKWNFL